jgi:hypothetical protein
MTPEPWLAVVEQWATCAHQAGVEACLRTIRNDVAAAPDHLTTFETALRVLCSAPLLLSDPEKRELIALLRSEVGRRLAAEPAETPRIRELRRLSRELANALNEWTIRSENVAVMEQELSALMRRERALNAEIEQASARAAELTQNMYELEYLLPESGEKKRQLLRMDDEQQIVYDVIHKK